MKKGFTEKQMKEIEEEKTKKQLIKDVMLEMEKRRFTTGEAEEFPNKLAEALKKNSERFEKEKPFAIYKY